MTVFSKPLTRDQITEVQAVKLAAKARDAAARPPIDAQAMISELRLTLGRMNKMRDSGWLTRRRVQDTVKAGGGVWNHTARSYRSMSESDIRIAETKIREITATIKQLTPLAERQMKERRERADRIRKIEEADRKLRGLGVTE